MDKLMMLKACLTMIEAADKKQDYHNRNLFILNALVLSDQCGFLAGFRLDPQDPEWPVAFIELPTGQVSWHVPQHSIPWDGHTTEQKYERIKDFATKENTDGF